ncbi:MAG: hypothetical protein Q8M79_00110 [Dehalococcoidia bacterium]|nr:hypothetical protein [Dehalococcoidia bacterium]
MTFVRNTGIVGPRHLQQWALVLVIAWIPGLTFFGHWTTLAAPLGLAPAAMHTHSASSDHAAHCHTDVSGCSDQAAGGAASVAPPALASVLIAAALALMLVALVERIPAGLAPVPASPPPRAA